MAIILLAILIFIGLMFYCLWQSERQEKANYLSNFEWYIRSIPTQNKRDQIVDLYINHLLSEMTSDT